jgi:unsaturated rhamnogalacturonyl hydrolase
MDPYKKIYHHAYFDDAGITNGAHWGRANGWVMMAQVELLDVLPEDHLMRPELLRILNQFVGGIARLQGQTGMWHQLLDRYDSYLESSCTAMFVYSIAKSVNNEWVDSSFAQVAWRGWQGLYGKITEDAQVTDICVGTHIEMNLPFYYNRPRSVNDTHGLASTILAGTEMIILQKSIGPRVNPRSF